MTCTTEELRDAIQTVFASGSPPKFMGISDEAAASFYAERVAQTFVERGSNWRRVKRERRKAYKTKIKSLSNQN